MFYYVIQRLADRKADALPVPARRTSLDDKAEPGGNGDGRHATDELVGRGDPVPVHP